MLFKKITYQGIRNYELWKKKNQQKQSTNNTARRTLKKFNNGEKQR